MGLLLIALACLLAPLYAADIAGSDPFRSDIQGTTVRHGRPIAVLAQNTAGLGLGATPIGPGGAAPTCWGRTGRAATWPPACSMAAAPHC